MAILNGKYKEYKLNNGLTVVLQTTPSQTIAGRLRVNQGAYHEKKGEEGIAHFLEHCLVTGGSKKYTPIQGDKIANSLGFVNAETSLGRTSFIGGMLNEDVNLWLDYLSDHIFNPRLDIKRVNGERERVLREISDKKSNSLYSFNRELYKTFYREHPNEKEIIGNEETVKNTSLEKLLDFHSRGFSPNNMDLILVGGLPEDIEESIEKYFGKYKKGNNTRKEFPTLKPLDKKYNLHISAPHLINKDNPKESSAIIVLNYIGPAEKDMNRYSFRAMTHLLGGDADSYLFKELGLKKGLAYSAEASYECYYNAGTAVITAKVPINRAKESINSIFNVINKMKNQIPDKKKVENFKKKVKYFVANSFESNSGHIEAIEAKLDLGITPEESLKNWDNVTPESIQKIADEYLPTKKGNYVLSLIDPLKKKE